MVSRSVDPAPDPGGHRPVPHSLASARNLTATVSLLLHLLVVGVVPFVEAGADTHELDHIVHVEAPDEDTCPPLHDHLTCQYCRVLARDQMIAQRIDVARVQLPTHPIAIGDIAPPVPDDIVRSALLPRAPPIV